MKGIMSRLLWPWNLHSGRGDPWIQPLGRLSAAAGEDVVTECLRWGVKRTQLTYASSSYRACQRPCPRGLTLRNRISFWEPCLAPAL
jgi:hypothetical protein